MILFPEIIDSEVQTANKRPIDKNHKWVGIIIHHTGVADQDLDKIAEDKWKSLFKNITSWFSNKESYVSAHFHIGRFGECIQVVDPDSHVAYHAGKSEFWNPFYRKLMTDWNIHAIGIELLGDGNKGVYSSAQYEKCAKLCALLMKRYSTINPLCIVGHEMISPGRKSDPGRFFDWQRLYRQIFVSFEKLD